MIHSIQWLLSPKVNNIKQYPKQQDASLITSTKSSRAIQAKTSEVAAFTLDNVNISTASNVTNNRTRKFKNRDKKFIAMEEHRCNVSYLPI